MRLLRDPRVVAAAEARLDVEAGAGVARHLDHDLIAQLEARAGDDARPVETHHSHVLADGASGDGVPRHGMLGHPTLGRHVDLRDARARAHNATSVPIPWPWRDHTRGAPSR